jgi:hypothetical protein
MAILIISCIFGTKFQYVYPKPSGHTNCYFFTNNPELKPQIESKGWIYQWINLELTSDELISSIQSKYIKFLQFLNDYPQFKSYDKIIYFDHKFNVDNTHIEALLKYHNPVVIRQTPAIKNSIWDEVSDSKSQYKYQKNMKATIKLIRGLLFLNQITENVRICNTGLILYNDHILIEPMINSIYNYCVEMNQPQCQIYWAICSQPYMHHIKRIPFNEVNPTWSIPDKN